MDTDHSSMLLTDARIRERVGQAVCLTGTARSGTTLVGSLIHSMRGVEYSFEPPTLVTLFLLLDQLPAEAWKLLYETYLFDEVMVNGLGGRFMNLNPHDDSSILRAKTCSEVFGRFEKSHPYGGLFDEGLQRTIAYKIPRLMPYIPALRQLYPGTRFLVMLRHPDPVALSTDRKGWFIPPQQTYRDSGTLREVDGQIVSAWIPPEDARQWMELSPLDRAYRYYASMYEPLLTQPDLLIVNYESLMDRTAEVSARIAERLGLEPGAKTAEIVASVHERHPRDLSPEGVSKECREQALEIHRQCARLAI